MKNSLCRKLILCAASIAVIFSIMTVSASAMGFSAGIARDGSNNSSNTNADSNTGNSSSGNNGMMGGGTAGNDGNIDSGTDGFIDENSGTGEFADENTTNGDNSRENGKNTSKSPVESAVDNVVTDGENAVEEVTGSMSVWGIVIAVVIIAAVAALLFALFSGKK